MSKPHLPTAQGPLGFPLTDRQAFALEALLKALPRDDAFAYRKSVLIQGPSEVLPGERSDVSWISTENPDRTCEVVIARGMNDSQYKLNPIVTLQHAYHLPPVGRSLWRKVVKDGDRRGIKAKTQYPARPADWEGSWPADVAFSLVQADLLRGKSVGFLPTRVHVPETKELEQNGWQKVNLVIDEWLLLEYACVFLPAQQNAVVEAVSKAAIPLPPDDILRLLNLDTALFQAPAPHLGETRRIPFTPLGEITKSVERRIASWDWHDLAKRAVANVLDRHRGRI
jgi:hypothetical protein